jgi:hypothetical protein
MCENDKTVVWRGDTKLWKTVGSHIGPIFQFWRKQGTIQVKNQHSLFFVFHVTASEAVSLLDFV